MNRPSPLLALLTLEQLEERVRLNGVAGIGVSSALRDEIQRRRMILSIRESVRDNNTDWSAYEDESTSTLITGTISGFWDDGSRPSCPICGGDIELVIDGSINLRPAPFVACASCEFCQEVRAMIIRNQSGFLVFVLPDGRQAMGPDCPPDAIEVRSPAVGWRWHDAEGNEWGSAGAALPGESLPRWRVVRCAFESNANTFEVGVRAANRLLGVETTFGAPTTPPASSAPLTNAPIRPRDVDFDTTEYEKAHGHRPRGAASWAFAERSRATQSDSYMYVKWFHMMSYTAARTAAARVFAAEGITEATVMP